MNLRIIKAGVLDTVQDLGRYGQQHLGINPGGAMDRLSAQTANCLVGNELGDPVIELHFPAGAFFFEQPALIAITGGDFTASVNGEEIGWSQPIVVNRYSILQFHGVRKGARAYLAVHGGLDIPRWLNSSSTNLKAGAGGYQGRALQKDDEIKMMAKRDFSAWLGKKEFEFLPWRADNDRSNPITSEVFVLPGHEWDELDDVSKEKFLQQSFALSTHSDRMGYHLKAAHLTMKGSREIVSAAVNFGTVQLLPGGQLIILMADHQTTGGYPRLAHVISAHHARLAQWRVGEKIRFRFVEQAMAEELYIKQCQHLLQLKNACKFRLETFFPE